MADFEAGRILPNVIRDYRLSWKPLAVTDIAFKVTAFILLTPLVGCLFRILLATTGKSIVSDVDILFFFLGPMGWLSLVLVGAIWLAIVALEQASLTGIVCAKQADQRLPTIAALRYAAAHAWPVLRVTARIVMLTALVIIPFLAIAAAVYFSLLTEYDINFYLKEKPPVFLVCLGIGGVLGVVLAAILLRLFSGWLFALPLVLFEGVRPAEALRISSERARGHRRTLVLWIVGWFLVTTLISAVLTGLVALLGDLLIPDTTSSLHWLVVAIGITVVAWAMIGLVVNLLSTTTFATILFNLYQRLGRPPEAGPPQVDTAKASGEGAGFQVTRKRLLIASVVGVVASAVVGTVLIRSFRVPDRVQIMAHRGSSKAAPENTLAAIRLAIEDGADWVEIDVQETADGEIAVFHDSDFMKVAGSNLKIWDATRDDLKEIDIGSWFAPEFRDERVPTLAQVLEECKGKIRVNIELKYYGHDVQLEQRVAEIVEAAEMASDIVLMSLKMEGVQKMKALRPEWRVGLLMSVSAGDLRKLEADFVAVNASFATRALLRNAHASGKEVFVWTVNDAPTMSMLIGRGVDGLLTDKPALARSVLEQRAQMRPVERLLLQLAGVLGSTPELGEA